MADNEPKWYYERLEEGKVKRAPTNDLDGKITGRHVYGLQAWLDENPEERKRLGYIKHIFHSTKDIEYDRATQYLARYARTIDEYTIEDEYHIMDKSEEMMRLEEIGYHGWWGDDSDDIITFGGV